MQLNLVTTSMPWCYKHDVANLCTLRRTQFMLMVMIALQCILEQTHVAYVTVRTVLKLEAQCQSMHAKAEPKS